LFPAAVIPYDEAGKRAVDTNVAAASSSVQRLPLAAALAMLAALFVALLDHGLRHALLLPLGAALGVTLYHAAFGFTGAYRRALLERDISGVSAQLLMLAAAMLLFAPVLAAGEAFGQGVGGALAPVDAGLLIGAFAFGIGMQLGGGCGSGTLYAAGGGNARMVLVLVFFCLGGFAASLHMPWWRALPSMGELSLGEAMGWAPAVLLQLLALALAYWALRRLGARNRRPLGWQGGFAWPKLVRGPWPLLLGAALLALLNWAVLLVAGHPWSITWAFTLWAAKAAHGLGWDPAGHPFWGDGFPADALAGPLLADTTSVTDIGILLGALSAAALAGRAAPRPGLSPPAVATAVLGGLLLGYGARLAYGCNIGAFFGGVASTSLHGWVWIVAAVAGNAAGVRLLPLVDRALSPARPAGAA
jgi:uncharacterized membrane protein YedE/YeeE